MKSLIRPLYYSDIMLFKAGWLDFVHRETSKEDRFLYPLRFFSLTFVLYKLFCLDDFWHNFLAYEVDGNIAGFMEVLPHPRNEEELFIKNFVILPDLRNKGYGGQFLEDIVREYTVKTFSLEVRENNPAVNFYKRYGFKSTGARIAVILRPENKKNTDNLLLSHIREWEPLRDSRRLNKIMKVCDEEDDFIGFNLLPFVPLNGIKFADMVTQKLKREALKIYVLEEEGEIIAYCVIYFYLKQDKALLEFVYIPSLSDEIIGAFVKFIISKVDRKITLLFSFTDRQRGVRIASVNGGGEIYRTDTIMKRQDIRL